MKIHRLHFKNINSLRGEHTVDFDAAPLEGAGLFAITGPTGAGKSTLLDVISLALYSQIPRVSTGRGVNKGLIEKTGLVLTENTTEAHAEVEFTCKAGRYISRWSIAKARTGNLKDHEMEVHDCQAGQLVDLKKSEVPQYIERLVGLTYEQFIRSMLLAQGEFARFLKTDKKERSELLEKITGSEIYRQIGRKAFEKNKEHGQELERLLDRARELRTEELPEAEYTELQSALAAADTALKEATEAQQAAQQALKDKEAYLALEAEMEQLKQALAQAQQARQDFDATEGPRLKRHEELLPLAESLQAWQQGQTDLAKQARQGAQWEARAQAAGNALTQALTQLQALVGEGQEGPQLLAALDDLEKRVSALQEQRQSALVRFGSLKEQAEPLASRTELALDYKDPAESRGRAMELQKGLEKEYHRASAQVPEGWRENPRQGQAEWQAGQTQLVEWKQLAQQDTELTAQREKLATTLAEKTQEADRLPRELATLQERRGRLEAEFTSLKKDLTIQQLQARVEDLRPKLVDGEPCPLCGAVHHPYAEHLPEATGGDLEGQLATKETELRQTEALITQKEQTGQQLAERLSELQADLAAQDSKHQRVQAALAALWEGVDPDEVPASPAEYAETLQRQQQALRVLEDTQAQMEGLLALSRLLQEMEAVVWEGKEVAGKIKQLYTGADIRQEANGLRSAYERAHTQQQEAAEGQRRWAAEQEALKQSLTEQEAALAPPLKPLGYPDAATALTHLLSPAAYAELTRQAHERQSAVEKLQEKLTDREQRRNEQAPTLAQATRESLQAALQEAQAAVADKQGLRDELHAQQVVQTRIRTELASLTERIDRQKAENERWVLLKQYIGDAKGEKFSAFAQDLTLQHLVGMANRRLAHLTHRYRLTMPEPDEQTDDSLAIVDQDLGQMQRSVKTLSGGESFLISLALALGLSDLASQEVEIKSLFIDEGFGTLDPETLDLTLDTLERLQAEGNKTIGVISHVEALKERIATQIIVKPNGQGHSTLSLVG